jgi:hypothetical protein
MSPLHVFITRLLVISVGFLTRRFYRFEVLWVGPKPPKAWKNIRVFAFLNHTSLLEPLFLGTLPVSFLWDAAKRTVVPGADITMNRPIAGTFYKYFSPRTVSITRERDDSWSGFLDEIKPDTMVALAPEGRMMRANGLDKRGKPMSVRGGIADILCKVQTGKMLIGYSGGLHHVNAPGEKRMRLFKTLKIRYEVLDIADYLKTFDTQDPKRLRKSVAEDLEQRLHKYKP